MPGWKNMNISKIKKDVTWTPNSIFDFLNWHPFALGGFFTVLVDLALCAPPCRRNVTGLRRSLQPLALPGLWRTATHYPPIYLYWDFRNFWYSPVWNIQFHGDIHYQLLVWWIHYTHCCESKKWKPGKFHLCSLWNDIFNYPNWDFRFC